MSKKNKMFRAWIHNYPDDGSERSAFEFGWRNGKKERARLAAENAKLEDQLAELAADYHAERLRGDSLFDQLAELREAATKVYENSWMHKRDKPEAHEAMMAMGAALQEVKRD